MKTICDSDDSKIFYQALKNHPQKKKKNSPQSETEIDPMKQNCVN